MATQTLPETELATTDKQPASQYVYFFGGGKADGNGKMKDELGGKGAGLAEMTNAGLPVPPGFTVQTEACREYMHMGAYRYDRFARSLRQLVLALEEFRALGIDFISLHEGVDTSTPNGRLVFGIFASIAEFERELIRDRVRSGLAAAKAKGKRIGRPKVAVDALRIASLRRQGRSWAQIKADTGISKGTAQRAMAGLPKTPVATAPPVALSSARKLT